jgi:hypothetical protein
MAVNMAWILPQFNRFAIARFHSTSVVYVANDAWHITTWSNCEFLCSVQLIKYWTRRRRDVKYENVRLNQINPQLVLATQRASVRQDSPMVCPNTMKRIVCPVVLGWVIPCWWQITPPMCRLPLKHGIPGQEDARRQRIQWTTRCMPFWISSRRQRTNWRSRTVWKRARSSVS